jgi:RNA polymerase sigma-B factor
MAAGPSRADTEAMLPRTMPTEALLRRYARERRPADLELLVRRFQPLARSVARRYRGASMARDDLEQAACLGLVGALQRFDPDRGCAFSTFAVPTILGEIRRQYRETLWPAHVPRLVKERVRQVRAAVDALVAQGGQAPAVDEIAALLGCDQEGVLEALVAAFTLNRVSLDRAYADEGDEGASLVASLGDDDPGFELAECRADIERAIPQLDDAERRVLRLRYADERTFAEIGRELALAPGQAARLARRSLDHLRALTSESGRTVAA